MAFITIILVFIVVEWISREQEYTITALVLKWKRQLRNTIYYCLVFAIFYYGEKSSNLFIFSFNL